MAVTPLSWPETLRHPTGLQKFFMGTPLFGPDRRAYHEFRRQVAARAQEACMGLWKQDKRTLWARDAVINILEKEMQWRSRSFIPSDPCDILFFDGSDGMDGIETLMRLEDMFGVRLEADEPYGVTVGELVDLIVARGQNPEGTVLGH